MICRSLPLVSLLSFFSSSRLSFSRRGEEELERCLRGDLARPARRVQPRGNRSSAGRLLGDGKGNGTRSCRHREPHLDRRRCGERERVLLLSLSRDRVRSLRLLSRSREADRERRRSAGSGAGDGQSAVSGGGGDEENGRRRRTRRRRAPLHPHGLGPPGKASGTSLGPVAPQSSRDPLPLLLASRGPQPRSRLPTASPRPVLLRPASLPLPYRAAAASGTGCGPLRRPSAPTSARSPPHFRRSAQYSPPSVRKQRRSALVPPPKRSGRSEPRRSPARAAPLGLQKREGLGAGPAARLEVPLSTITCSHAPTPPHPSMDSELSGAERGVYLCTGRRYTALPAATHSPTPRPPTPRGLQPSSSAVMVPQSLFVASSSAPGWLRCGHSPGKGSPKAPMGAVVSGVLRAAVGAGRGEKAARENGGVWVTQRGELRVNRGKKG